VHLPRTGPDAEIEVHTPREVTLATLPTFV
jgi:hypothetical protein